MPTYAFDQEEWKQKLTKLFKENKADLKSFGVRVNQTFEAAVFAKTILFFKNSGWKTKLRNPIYKKKEVFKLKFSTRGAPGNYSYAICENEDKKIEIRHQLRVKTKKQPASGRSSNICCDIAIIEIIDTLNDEPTDYAIENKNLITFGEVKHMSAFPELIASFIGLVHELKPEYIEQNDQTSIPANNVGLFPYLYLSGYLAGTADALVESIEDRKYCIDVYHVNNNMVSDDEETI